MPSGWLNRMMPTPRTFKTSCLNPLQTKNPEDFLGVFILLNDLEEEGLAKSTLGVHFAVQNLVP